MPELLSETEHRLEKLVEPTEEANVLSLVIRRFIAAEAFRKNLETKWNNYYKYYRGYRDKKDFPWMSNLHTPVAFTVIESLLPRILATIFGPKFVVEILPREKGDVLYAKVVEQLLSYQFERMNAFSKFYNWIKQCLLYGTGILKVFWQLDVKRRKVLKPEYVAGIKIGTKEYEENIIEYDEPNIEVVDIYDFYVDPRATSIDNARWCIQRFWKDYDYLLEKQKQGFYKNVEKVKPGVGQIQDIMKPVRAEVTGMPSGIVEGDELKVELLEYWEDNRVITVANRQVILRDEPNPFMHGKKPFIVIKDIDMPQEFYGIGEIEPIESLINERNEIRNQRMDNMKTIVNKVLIVDRNADIDLDRLEEMNRPGGVILTDNINAIKPLETGDIVASAYNEDAMILRDIQDATAMAEYAIGVMPRRTETATAVLQLQQSAMTRFTLKIQNIIQNGVIPLVKMLIQLNQQFLDKPRVIRILGEEGLEFREISANDISGNYDLIPAVGLLEVNKEIKRQQLLLLANNPLFTLPNVNIEEFQKEILRQFDFKDVDLYIRPMTEIQQMQMETPDAVIPGVAGRGIRAQRRRRVAAGVPSIAGVAGVPMPQR